MHIAIPVSSKHTLVTVDNKTTTTARAEGFVTAAYCAHLEELAPCGVGPVDAALHNEQHRVQDRHDSDEARVLNTFESVRHRRRGETTRTPRRIERMHAGSAHGRRGGRGEMRKSGKLTPCAFNTMMTKMPGSLIVATRCVVLVFADVQNTLDTTG